MPTEIDLTAIQARADKAMPGQCEPKYHVLKVWPEFYAAIVDGTKTFEIRKNDRDFRAGDTLHLREYEPHSDRYTGQAVARNVSYVFYGGTFGIPADMCVMALEPDIAGLTAELEQVKRERDDWRKAAQSNLEAAVQYEAERDEAVNRARDLRRDMAQYRSDLLHVVGAMDAALEVTAPQVGTIASPATTTPERLPPTQSSVPVAGPRVPRPGVFTPEQAAAMEAGIRKDEEALRDKVAGLRAQEGGEDE